MTRRKVLVARYPNGQPRRPPTELMSPTEGRRLIDAAKSGLKDGVWGTMLGRLCVAEKITVAQFMAGKKWSELARNYSITSQSPKEPRTAKLAPEGGTPADPDSPRGLREAQRHTQIKHQYLATLSVLNHASKPVRRSVRDVCELGQYPAGEDEMQALRAGLNVLAIWWSGEKRK